jgi:hypothetical protein
LFNKIVNNAANVLSFSNSPKNITFAAVKTKSFTGIAQVVELVDTQDLKSCGQKWLYGFDSRPEHEAERPAKFLAGLFLPCRGKFIAFKKVNYHIINMI